MIDVKSRGSGYYRVYVDDVEISQHITEREAEGKAIEEAINLAFDNPSAKVHYAHDYEVDVTINAKDITLKAISGGTLTQPDSEPDPIAGLFVDETDVPASDTRLSNQIQILGVDSFASVTIEVSGDGGYRLNGGLLTTAPSVGTLGDLIALEHQSNATAGLDANTTLTLDGTISDTFTSTTVSSGYPAQTGDYYVATSGSDSNSGTSRDQPYRNINTAIEDCPSGGTIVILGDGPNSGYEGGIWADKLGDFPGSAGNFKTITGEFPNTKVWGSVGNWLDFEDFNPTQNAYWQIRDCLFMQQRNLGVQRYDYGSGPDTGGGQSTSLSDNGCQSITKGTNYLSFFRCGWYGSATGGSPKNLLVGNYNCFDYCYAFGGGARYWVQAFESEYNVFRRFVIRMDEGWTGGNSGNPNGGLQIYSSVNCVMLQCIAVDGVAGDSSKGSVSAINQTFKNLGPTSNATAARPSFDAEQCIVSDHYWTAYLSEDADGGNGYYINDGSVARRMFRGFFFDSDAGGSEDYVSNADVRLCEIDPSSGSTSSGVGINNNKGTFVSLINCNSADNERSDYLGSFDVDSGNTSSTAPFNWQGMEIIGEEGKFYGESGYRDVQSGQYLFGSGGSGFAYEDVIREAFLMYENPNSSPSAGTNANRGFCANGQTLTNYLWRDD